MAVVELVVQAARVAAAVGAEHYLMEQGAPEIHQVLVHLKEMPVVVDFLELITVLAVGAVPVQLDLQVLQRLVETAAMAYQV